MTGDERREASYGAVFMEKVGQGQESYYTGKRNSASGRTEEAVFSISLMKASRIQ